MRAGDRTTAPPVRNGVTVRAIVVQVSKVSRCVGRLGHRQGVRHQAFRNASIAAAWSAGQERQSTRDSPWAS